MNEQPYPQPTPDPVPFPTQMGPRMVGQRQEPNGQPVQARQPMPPPQQPAPQQQSFGHSSDSAAAFIRLQQMKMGAGAGLFDIASFIAECIGNYQQQYQEYTGQRIEFRDALEQVIMLLAE